ncbi:hypothetical protein HDV06_000773 [Boothiomyces sp. JEL0866]|nr:hypothetical protein HDV06_000773 [Boothiomyces sp. JEL0866]
MLKAEKLWDYNTQSVVKTEQAKQILFQNLSPEFQDLTVELQTGDLVWQFLLDYFQPSKPTADKEKLEIIKKLCLFKSDNIIDYMNGLNEMIQNEKEFSFNLNELGIALALSSLPPTFKNEIDTLESLDLESVCLQWTNAEQVLGKEIFSYVPSVTHGAQSPSGRETPTRPQTPNSGRNTPSGRKTPTSRNTPRIVNRNTPLARINQTTNSKPQPKLARFQMIAIKETFESFCKFGSGTDLHTMDGTRFAKFCKDCSITNQKLKQHQIDIIFNKIKSPKERRINQKKMLVALGSFAHKYYSLSRDDPMYITLAVSILRLLSKISPEMLKIPKQLEYHECECYTLYHEPTFTMSFFLMRKGHFMPLHDHPNMTVFFKLIKGEMLVNSYEIISHDPIIAKKISRVITPKSLYSGLKLDSQRMNLHSFYCISDEAIFMDIIGPPYNDTDRTCTYYQDKLLVEQLQGSQTNLVPEEFELAGKTVLLNTYSTVELEKVELDYNVFSTVYQQ